ncbi:MAG: sigma 54-interacting transcriptional regulator [Leptospiraceae bacterium]|nr:sigma-54-dependent Fis family transcriptional regulator [Leptospiraceae bacterium]MCK6382388.1 sigma 54-interacting transcriptional regulator [Leptospiraceae bacterium]NUM41041.1 sigma-54-dependent Fis family transcriptional regulator [Leptospiraceae bacterium]
MTEKQIVFGKSKETQKTKDLLDQIAQNKLSVLIEGESGTGKDTYAEYIFANIEESKYHLKIDSSILSNFVLEEILSKFPQNELVYLWIDRLEILNLESQGLLLQWINNCENNYKHIRFVFFSSSSLSKLVSEKIFREDLYFRINKIKILISPLRNRREEIAELVNYFIVNFSSKHNKNIQSVDKGFESFLYNYHWSGNIRELENFIERVIIFSKKNSLDEKEIPSEIFSPNRITRNLNIVAGIPLVDYEKEILIKNLEFVNWNRNKAAAILGISERTLYRKIKEFQITNPKFV